MQREGRHYELTSWVGLGKTLPTQVTARPAPRVAELGRNARGSPTATGLDGTLEGG